jgi:hypothetical protein
MFFIGAGSDMRVIQNTLSSCQDDGGLPVIKTGAGVLLHSVSGLPLTSKHIEFQECEYVCTCSVRT